MNVKPAPLLEVTGLNVHFGGTGFIPGLRTPPLRAVNDVSLAVMPGETLGLVGESGSGKSTLGRAILRLGELTSGEIVFDGTDMARATVGDLNRLRRQSAMIFQDPYGALNPRMRVGDAIAEVLRVHRKVPSSRIGSRIAELLNLVGLDAGYANSRPLDLSGGQCQRIGIARALAVEPKLIVADECVAALDVSIQGQILNLLMDLREQIGMAIIFIAHDLAIVRRLCDRVAVMYLGRIVETGPTEEVFTEPRHPYTASLLRAIPDIDPDRGLPENPLAGEPPSPIALPCGCAFHPRCPNALPDCSTGEPPRLGRDGPHRAACILPPGEIRI
ncbi:ABC transporter ATP-binding protein [Roseibium marinum]|uniref:Peptide/nickel transport system ATP-binding protein n=1 Tax=Roseibium marinum TaxID=281252 RepID=A0A2S3UJY8_9HYPH|nr:peptide/nickel transport system ATP-binding protein [Roseibium marinum]